MIAREAFVNFITNDKLERFGAINDLTRVSSNPSAGFTFNYGMLEALRQMHDDGRIDVPCVPDCIVPSILNTTQIQ